MSGAGAGKGLLARCIAMIAFGREPHAVTGGSTAEELEKRISAELIEGNPVLFLDNQHRLLKHEEMFRGTLTHTSVYPREVARRALELNSAAVILAHNHPSGAAEPSRADEFLTQSLKSALQLVDVRVLDHLVVGRGTVVSFAERGLL